MQITNPLKCIRSCNSKKPPRHTRKHLGTIASKWFINQCTSYVSPFHFPKHGDIMLTCRKNHFQTHYDNIHTKHHLQTIKNHIDFIQKLQIQLPLR